MRRNFYLVMNKLALMLLLVVLLGCSAPLPRADDSESTPEKVGLVVSANNQFAFELFSRLDKSNNVFFSPYSISTALAMTFEGARGRTAEEMQSVFHFPEDSVRRPGFASIYNDLNRKDKKYALNTANALWAQKDFGFLPDYMSVVEKYYSGKSTNVDFVNAPEQSRVTINDWVEQQTKNKIKDLLPASPPVINPLTRLVLTNAIYFKGDWLFQFDKRKTQEADFKVSPDKAVKVQMMGLSDEEFNYADMGDLQAIELPYAGKELSMLVLLPDDINSFELSAEYLKMLKNNMRKSEIPVYLPKFKLETKYFLSEDLKAMGMPTAFDMDADFSGMTGTDDLFISSVIHQAFVEVNEEGTEAAAATAVIMELKAVMIKPFRADHPFIFLIQDKNNNILFLGRVVNPE
ncbi:MAG: serpin family protein [Candidatus Woesearchaeota archaeon]|nr:serpin family protein [Candidatus Woesearchaeota archaeon]